MYEQQKYDFKKEMTKDQKNMKKESMRLINSLRVYQINENNQISTEDSKNLLAFKNRNTQAFSARSNFIKKTIQNQIYKDNKVIPSRTANILNLTMPLKSRNNEDSNDSFKSDSSLERAKNDVANKKISDDDEAYEKYKLERQDILQK